MEIYLDNSATTACFEEVAEAVSYMMTKEYGNPSSMHRKGSDAEREVARASETIAATLKVMPKEILYTSGGTESDNLAIIGAAYAYQRQGKHIITTKIEHPAVLQCMQYLQSQGFEITYVPVDACGCVCTDALISAIRPDTILVSVMAVNNEIGTVQPIAKLGECIKKRNPGTLFHVDAVQGYGKVPIYPRRYKIDMLSVSGHKIHGPKGVGFLYVNEKVRLKPLTHGGGQQKGLRSGTENVSGIVGLAKAADLVYRDMEKDTERMSELRSYFVSRLKEIENVYVNGGKDCCQAAPHIVSLSVPGVRSEVLLHALEEKGIYVSAGSACASHKATVSETLKAIGLPKEHLSSTIRFSFSVFTTREELEYTLQCLKEIITELRRFTRR